MCFLYACALIHDHDYDNDHELKLILNYSVINYNIFILLFGSYFKLLPNGTFINQIVFGFLDSHLWTNVFFLLKCYSLLGICPNNFIFYY